MSVRSRQNAGSRPAGAIRRRLVNMRIRSGRSVKEKLVVLDEAIEVGKIVTVVEDDGDEGFTLTPEQENELLESAAEIERGEWVSWEELQAELERK